MDLAVQFGIFVAGLLVLVVGAELFIRGAVTVARSFGISPFVIGLVLVGFGTSAPELVVNVAAAWNGSPGLALGNIVGSNIANIGLILGCAAVVMPLVVQMRLLKAEVPIVVGVTGLLWVLALDGELSRSDGWILMAVFAGVMLYFVKFSPSEPSEVKQELGEQVAEKRLPWGGGILLLIGLGGLLGGAELMVRAAVTIATAWGVSEVVVGLTVVAIGTSLPELASSLVAAYRGQPDIAVGNVLGSNIFNIVLILGVTTQVAPLPVPTDLLHRDIPVMAGFAVLLVAVLANGLVVRRWEGAILLAAFAGFVGWQVSQAG